MYKIEYRSAVLRDLEEATTYLCNELQALTAANRLLDGLDTLAQNLSEQPYMFRAYGSVLTLSDTYRIAPIDSYILFYTVDEAKQTVSFCRLFYNRRDFDNLLP